MKIAISGKGGVGKSTLSAALSLLLAKRGTRVLAVDADPDANLAAALGIPESQQQEIIPISQHKALIEERTGAKVKQFGQMFKLNPEVSDIADEYAIKHNGVDLMVLGAIDQGGGSGCACPESVLLKALVTDLIPYKDEAFIMDMEAGVEHLGRATARGVDTMIIVVEPGQRSIDCAHRVIKMAAEIGLKQIKIVGSKVHDAGDEAFIRNGLPNCDILGMIPLSKALRNNDRDGCSVLDDIDGELRGTFESILNNLLGAEA